MYTESCCNLAVGRVSLVLCLGSLPNSFSGLTMLIVLDLAKSDSYTRGHYEGRIFDVLNSSSLKYLHIYNNRFNGSTDSLNAFPDLITLLMHTNQVYGQVTPTDIVVFVCGHL